MIDSLWFVTVAQGKRKEKKERLVCMKCMSSTDLLFFTVSSSAVAIENGTFTWSNRDAPVLRE